MRFVDSNVITYAYFLPKGNIDKSTKVLKEKSKKIIGRITSGEEIATSVVHISEAINILQKSFDVATVSQLLLGFFTSSNIKVFEVNFTIYIRALEMAKEMNISINDCVALVIMGDNGITEIYTADKDFKKAADIKVIFD